MRWRMPSVQLTRMVHAAVLLVSGWPALKRRDHHQVNTEKPVTMARMTGAELVACVDAVLE
jgi:hypothetical protein